MQAQRLKSFIPKDNGVAATNQVEKYNLICSLKDTLTYICGLVHFSL
jgi:hypothetical protein